MRISYWSSDVCSSDLARILRGQADDLAILLGPQIGQLVAREEVDKGKAVVLAAKRDRRFHRRRQFHRRGVREFSRPRIGSGGGDGFGFLLAAGEHVERGLRGGTGYGVQRGAVLRL